MGALVQGSHPGWSHPPGTPGDVSERHGLEGLLQGLLRGRGLERLLHPLCAWALSQQRTIQTLGRQHSGREALVFCVPSPVPWPQMGLEAIELQVWQGSTQSCLPLFFLSRRGEGSPPGLLGKVQESRCQSLPPKSGFRGPWPPLCWGADRGLGWHPGCRPSPLCTLCVCLTWPSDLRSSSQPAMASGRRLRAAGSEQSSCHKRAAGSTRVWPQAQPDPSGRPASPGPRGREA